MGQIAKRQAITNPENTVFAVKRLIGRRYSSKEVQNDIKILPYKIEQAKNGDLRINLRGKVNWLNVSAIPRNVPCPTTVR